MVIGIASLFDYIETGSPTGQRKEEAIRDIFSQLAISPRDAVYVGDAPSDIIASKNVGVPVIAAAWANTTDVERLRALNPDWLFTSVPEFEEFVQSSLKTS